MKRYSVYKLYIVFITLLVGSCMNEIYAQTVALETEGAQASMAVDVAIAKRRSIRSFKDEPILLNELSRLLWAAQGITDKPQKLRAAPSAGALYPLELYVVVANVQGLPAGVYKYVVEIHALEKVSEGDKRTEITKASYDQSWITDAGAIIVICGVYERVRRKYGIRASRYVHMEVGAVAENIYLQGQALKIGTCFVGGFEDKKVQRVIESKRYEIPLAVLPFGKIE